MISLESLVKNIQKNREADHAWNVFYDHFMDTTAQLCWITFSLNYVSMLEMRWDFKNDAIRELCHRLDRVVEKVIQWETLGEFEEKKAFLQEQIKKIDNLRKDLEEIVSCATAYVDRYLLLEYAFNRTEHLYDDRHLPADYQDDDFVQKLSAFIFSTPDSSIIQQRMVGVIEQLPIRMTKARFFEYLREAFSTYIDGERKPVEDLCYFIRSVSMLEEPTSNQAFERAYDSHVELLMDQPLSELNPETYQEYTRMLQEDMTHLDNEMGFLSLFGQLVNEFYGLLLAKEHDLTEIEHTRKVREACIRIVRTVNQYGLEEKQDNVFDEIQESLYLLEGEQEPLHEEFHRADALLDEVFRSPLMDSPKPWIQETLKASGMVSRLLSTSLFASLQEDFTEEQDRADTPYVYEQYTQIRAALSTAFDARGKLLSRGMMSRMIHLFPALFHNRKELEEYMKNSLSACQNESEKLGCYEILTEMMKEQELTF